MIIANPDSISEEQIIDFESSQKFVNPFQSFKFYESLNHSKTYKSDYIALVDGDKLLRHLDT